MNQLLPIRLTLAAFATIGFYTVSNAQSYDDAMGAAVRLKQAHVVRSYERCVAMGKSDLECRSKIEDLHTRELSVISRFFILSNSVQQDELNHTMASCYDPSRDYKELIECWEENATGLESQESNSTIIATELDPKQINLQILERHIVKQLQCNETPDPILSFLAFEKLGKIRTSEMIGYDSISCFKIHGGFMVNGLTLTSVCGYSNSSLEQQLFPDFLWRGPGTSPFQFISFGTQANFETVSGWYQRTFNGVKLLNQAIKTEHTSLGDSTEIQCSSLMLD